MFTFSFIPHNNYYYCKQTFLITHCPKMDLIEYHGMQLGLGSTQWLLIDNGIGGWEGRGNVQL